MEGFPSPSIKREDSQVESSPQMRRWQMRTKGRMHWIKSTSVDTMCVRGEWCRCDFPRKIP